MIAYGNVILFYKITGASGMPRPTMAYVVGTINYNLNEMFCILQKIPSYVILNLSKFNKKGDEYAGN